MRTVGSSRDKTWPIIRKAGITLLFKYGFQGMNLRLLASESGLQAGSLYNYFDNKNEFLATIVCDIMNELLQEILESLESVQSPEQRLRNFVSAMVVWHTKRKKEAIISHSEIRNLPKGRYEELIGLRKEFELILRKIIEDGIGEGLFQVVDTRLVVVAILNMLTGIAGWYKPAGRLDVETLVEEYTGIVLKLLSLDKDKKAATRRTR